jgi:hypothetical protein
LITARRTPRHVETAKDIFRDANHALENTATVLGLQAVRFAFLRPKWPKPGGRVFSLKFDG